MKPGFIRRVFRHLFVDKSYQDYYSDDSWTQSYQDGYDLDVDNQDGRYGVLLALLERYASDGPVLDAGCGDGVLASRIRRASDVSLVGIDYAESAIQIADTRNLENCKFQTSDFRAFKSDEAFSVIIFNESIYYVEGATDLLMSMQDMLKTDGVFLISMFETRVTRRIWKDIGKHFRTLQGVRVKDEGTGRVWHVRVLRSK